MDNNMNDKLREGIGEAASEEIASHMNEQTVSQSASALGYPEEQVRPQEPLAAQTAPSFQPPLQAQEPLAAQTAPSVQPPLQAQEPLSAQTPPPAQPPFQAQTGAYKAPDANAAPYYRVPQGIPVHRAEWSNTGAYNPQGAPSPYGRPAYYPPQGTQRTQGVPAQPQRPAPYGQSAPQPTAQKTQKRGVTIAIVAVICAAAVLLSGLAGFVGARYANGWDGSTKYKVRDNDSPASIGGADIQNDTTIIYRSVSTDDGAASTANVNDVVNAVADSVVEITTNFKSTGYWQYVQQGAGSGVIISDNGYIVTNNHVIMNDGALADTITVRLRDGREFEAKIKGYDEDEDIAVVKIEATGLTAAVFGDSSKLVVGEDIVAIGNPLGELGGTVTEGIISALDREIDVEGTKMNLLQISAAINPGNSGGGLFNMKGELVGIVNAKSSGSGIEGLGFAIPSDDASHIVEELITHGYVTGKPYIGISTYYASDAYTAYRLFRSQAAGLYIYETIAGYNETVLKVGDRIAEVNGKEIVTGDDLAQAVKNSKIGDTLTLTVYRGGQRVEVEVTVYEYVPEGVEFNP